MGEAQKNMQNEIGNILDVSLAELKQVVDELLNTTNFRTWWYLIIVLFLRLPAVIVQQ